MGSNTNTSNYDLSFKVLLIGDSGVGKSSLLVSFISSALEDLAPTIGVDFKIKMLSVGGKRLKLTIWDTVGCSKKCAIAIHHGGSGSTAAALYAGIPQVICPFTLDQFYWAERMCWLGIAPEPLRRNQLLPEYCDEVKIMTGANVLKEAINHAMSLEIKARAQEISEKITQENGVSEAVRILKEEVN